MAARSAFEAIQQCEPSVGQSGLAYERRLENAENNLAMLQRLEPLAQAQGDRRVRYVLKSYLREVTNCRQEEKSGQGQDDHCQEMLRYRAALSHWLK